MAQQIVSLLQKMQTDIVEIKSKLIEIDKKLDNRIEKVLGSEIQTQIHFPMTTEKELNDFNEILSDEQEFHNYTKSFEKQLQILRSAKTLYNRRRCLREILFSE